jgi:hypothetical protein
MDLSRACRPVPGHAGVYEVGEVGFYITAGQLAQVNLNGFGGYVLARSARPKRKRKRADLTKRKPAALPAQDVPCRMKRNDDDLMSILIILGADDVKAANNPFVSTAAPPSPDQSERL